MKRDLVIRNGAGTTGTITICTVNFREGDVCTQCGQHTPRTTEQQILLMRAEGKKLADYLCNNVSSPITEAVRDELLSRLGSPR